jgi:hypothetical protein
LETAAGDGSDGRSRWDAFLIYEPFETPEGGQMLAHQLFYEE